MPLRAIIPKPVATAIVINIGVTRLKILVGEIIDKVDMGDGWEWLHACQGHKDLYDNEGPYRKEGND